MNMVGHPSKGGTGFFHAESLVSRSALRNTSRRPSPKESTLSAPKVAKAEATQAMLPPRS